MLSFVPRIVVFCCDNSGYAAAEMAGALRLEIPQGVEIVRVPCAGRVENLYLFEALEKGADALLIFACHEENCQYLTGETRARKRLSSLRRLIEAIGIERERLEICNIAPNDGVKFANALSRKIKDLERFGPNPLREFQQDGRGKGDEGG